MKITDALRSWVVHLIQENRPFWLANGVEIGRANRIDISATVSKTGDTIAISGTGAGAHGIVSASHTAAGLTAGDVLQALTETTFGFGGITDGMLPVTIARDTEITTALTDHTEASNPHPQYELGGGVYVPLSLIDAKGDLIVGTADNAATRKVVGADDTILTADSAETTGVKWEKPKFVTYLVFGTEDQTYNV